MLLVAAVVARDSCHAGRWTAAAAAPARACSVAAYFFAAVCLLLSLSFLSLCSSYCW